MPKNWNKGLTKYTHPSVLKISQTMRDKKIDNFKKWRENQRKNGLMFSSYPNLKKDGDLAELIGVILGDGHLEKFPRTERLLIFSNSNNKGFANRYAGLVKKIFNKEPYVYKQSSQNCIRVSLYQKNLSKRLKIPNGSRKNFNFRLPAWIENDRSFLIRFLRGLFEAEGLYSIHKPTYTYKFSFSNLNQSLLKIVYKSLKVLGFSPSMDMVRVQLSRQVEVNKAIELLEFRKY